MVIVKSFPDFHCHRLPDCFHHFPQNFFCQRRILHKRGSLPVIYHFRDRASHIEVQNLKRSFLNLRRHIRNNIRIGAKQLQRHRMLPGVNFQQFFRVFIPVINRFRTDHLHAKQARALFPAQQTERQIRNSCHRRQNQRIVQGYTSDLQCVHLSLPITVFSAFQKSDAFPSGSASDHIHL